VLQILDLFRKGVGQASEPAHRHSHRQILSFNEGGRNVIVIGTAALDRLCAALADGMPIKGACVVAGIGVTTLAEWRERHPRLEDRMSQARELARQKALQAIKAAGEKDWRARVEWLRLTFPADYRGSGHKVEVQQAVQVQISPEHSQAASNGAYIAEVEGHISGGWNNN
jgi:hypothetical protein